MAIILITLALAIGTSSAWMTDWDQHFTFSCPDNEMLKTIESIHDNGKEDRVFNFGCTPVPFGASLSGCEWSGYANDYDKLLEFQCHNDAVITGIDSVHDNGKEDRRYKFRCCNPVGLVTHACEYTGIINNYDAHLLYRAPDGMAIKGVSSRHDNGKE
ncbi:hemagglutinin/amebocyte aggregation factor [Plakobranchus ocellatus]|uniref:Hemagglutinin/amebocyte aggregation factor n=1 Tax=Plakobranchus ocellatus TaxID=259542 RepID=A0AAV4DWI9_9GAST|nr:hemagglutinin/amebocyte aggregation factor [Plakobranchus ocellatus]